MPFPRQAALSAEQEKAPETRRPWLGEGSHHQAIHAGHGVASRTASAGSLRCTPMHLFMQPVADACSGSLRGRDAVSFTNMRLPIQLAGRHGRPLRSRRRTYINPWAPRSAAVTVRLECTLPADNRLAIAPAHRPHPA